MSNRRVAALLAVALLGSLSACNSSGNSVAFSGAGGTFVYPVMTRWIQDFSQTHPNKAKRTALKQFIQYVITGGQATAGALNYAPLPDGVRQYDQQQLQLLTADGQPINQE